MPDSMTCAMQSSAAKTVIGSMIDRIEQHSRGLQTKSAAILAEARSRLSVDAFCALDRRNDIDEAIQQAERDLAAASDVQHRTRP